MAETSSEATVAESTADVRQAEEAPADKTNVQGLAEIAWAYQVEQLRQKSDDGEDAEKTAVDAIFAEFAEV